MINGKNVKRYIFWDITHCSSLCFDPEDGSDMFLRNIFITSAVRTSHSAMVKNCLEGSGQNNVKSFNFHYSMRLRKIMPITVAARFKA
jgi:hypothetical protein